MYILTTKDLEHLKTLHPEARLAFNEALCFANIWAAQPETWAKYKSLFKAGTQCFTIRVTNSRRDKYIQAGRYSQGRRWDRDKALWTVVGPTVTNTLDSKHLDGLAIDVAPFENGLKPIWPEPAHDYPLAKEFWLELAGLFTANEQIKAGAHWKNPDHPHFEYTLLGEEK